MADREWFCNTRARVRVWQRGRTVVCEVGRTRYEAATGSVAEARAVCGYLAGNLRIYCGGDLRWRARQMTRGHGVCFREYQQHPSQARFQRLRAALAVELCNTWLVGAFAVAMGALGRVVAWDQLDGTTKRFMLLDLSDTWLSCAFAADQLDDTTKRFMLLEL